MRTSTISGTPRPALYIKPKNILLHSNIKPLVKMSRGI
jgi:hypothetical protein